MWSPALSDADRSCTVKTVATSTAALSSTPTATVFPYFQYHHEPVYDPPTCAETVLRDEGNSDALVVPDSYCAVFVHAGDEYFLGAKLYIPAGRGVLKPYNSLATCVRPVDILFCICIKLLY
ncbi:hypothetical protein VTP01DRAFT_611 [Rhizomucor pusillus]|uniref:uncharacterized protein n=1 Tax=Rhizomucor pusillus TaxID=4840 RepID=UPI0037436AD6